jgi:hypothetical protein
MKRINPIAILLIVIGLGSFFVVLAYTAYNASSYSNWYTQGITGQTYQAYQTYSAYEPYQSYPPSQNVSSTPITIDQTKTMAQEYLQSLGDPNLGIKEIMEFQYNFYIQFYEKDTGMGAFEMLIWKQVPPYGLTGSGMGMMYGRVVPGVMVPEPGPSMMWNRRYGLANGGMMGLISQATSTMPISKGQALQVAQAYLDGTFNGATVEQDATQFYGYYTMDFMINGKIAGMLSVNGYTGQVWVHTWHGAFIQEIMMG